jgi:hypothetical protein
MKISKVGGDCSWCDNIKKALSIPSCSFSLVLSNYYPDKHTVQVYFCVMMLYIPLVVTAFVVRSVAVCVKPLIIDTDLLNFVRMTNYSPKKWSLAKSA